MVLKVHSTRVEQTQFNSKSSASRTRSRPLYGSEFIMSGKYSQLAQLIWLVASWETQRGKHVNANGSIFRGANFNESEFTWTERGQFIATGWITKVFYSTSLPGPLRGSIIFLSKSTTNDHQSVQLSIRRFLHRARKQKKCGHTYWVCFTFYFCCFCHCTSYHTLHLSIDTVICCK